MRKRKKPEISILISGLNEEKLVKPLLSEVIHVVKKNKINGEILFMDDHSTDNTGKIADQIASKNRIVRVIHRKGVHGESKGGVGNSIRDGFRNSRGDYVLYMDCDSHNPKHIPEFFKHRRDADIIIGSRFVKGGGAEMPLTRWLATAPFNFTAKILLNLKVRDLTSGYKLYSKKMLDNLKLDSEGFGIHVEIPLKAFSRGYSAIEIPIYYKKSHKKSTLNYRKQFFSYTIPLVNAIKKRYFGIGY
jgi:dolichol-phosphate mannosyltransferase